MPLGRLISLPHLASRRCRAVHTPAPLRMSSRRAQPRCVPPCRLFLCFRSASALLPLCFRSASALLPLCVRSASALWPPRRSMSVGPAVSAVCSVCSATRRSVRRVAPVDARSVLHTLTAPWRRAGGGRGLREGGCGCRVDFRPQPRDTSIADQGQLHQHGHVGHAPPSGCRIARQSARSPIHGSAV